MEYLPAPASPYQQFINYQLHKTIIQSISLPNILINKIPAAISNL